MGAEQEREREAPIEIGGVSLAWAACLCLPSALATCTSVYLGARQECGQSTSIGSGSFFFIFIGICFLCPHVPVHSSRVAGSDPGAWLHLGIEARADVLDPRGRRTQPSPAEGDNDTGAAGLPPASVSGLDWTAHSLPTPSPPMPWKSAGHNTRLLFLGTHFHFLVFLLSNNNPLRILHHLHHVPPPQRVFFHPLHLGLSCNQHFRSDASLCREPEAFASKRHGTHAHRRTRTHLQNLVIASGPHLHSSSPPLQLLITFPVHFLETSVPSIANTIPFEPSLPSLSQLRGWDADHSQTPHILQDGPAGRRLSRLP